MDPINILLVDDSKSARYALRLQLQRHGVLVETADSAESGLERIGRTPPDAVLMDHTMPGMNGFEALEILKSDPSTADIPVVMCTSHDDPVYATQALKRGALTVLTKAAAQEHLPQVLDKIRAALNTGQHMPALPGESPQDLTTAAAPPAPAAPVTPGPTRAEVDEWIEAYLTQHLAQSLGPLIEPHLHRLTTELRRVIVEQVEMAVDALPPPPPPPPPPPAPVVAPPTPPTPQIDLDELRNDIVPLAVRRHFDAERDNILQLMQQCMQESQASQADDSEILERIQQRVESSVTTQTAGIVREETQAAVAAALAEHRETLATLRRSLRLSYMLGAAGLVLGSAIAVYVFLLT